MPTNIAIIGAGAVGSATAYALMIKDMAAEILLIDANEQKEEGEAMDIGDAHCFVQTGGIRAATFREARSADIIIITAGAAQKPGETRLDLVAKNTIILKSILKSIGKIQKNAIIIIVTNPVDIMTAIAQKIIRLPLAQIFGSGTTLDTARLKQMIAKSVGVSPQNVHGYVLGEHGDSEFVAWSTVRVAGLSLDEIGMSSAEQEALAERVKTQAYEIINRKGATNYGIGLTVSNIVEAIIHDQHLILSVSSRITNWNGVSGVCLGAPAVIGAHGVEKLWPLTLPPDEVEKLHASAEKIRKFL